MTIRIPEKAGTAPKSGQREKGMVINMKIKNRKRRYKRSDKFAYVFLIPWLAGIALFVALPLIQSLYFSLCNVNMTANGRVYQFTGFSNYIDIWVKDIFFIRRLLNFLLTTVLRMPIIVIFSLIIALMLNTKIKLKGLFRTIYFLPVIVASGPIIRELAAQGATTVSAIDQTGVMQAVSSFFPLWLAEPISLLFSQLIMILWYSGIQILIFLSVLQKMDLNMYEAARIDGATGWEIFWKITLPAIRSVILLNSVYTIVYLSNSDLNDVIILISNNILNPQRGYGFASAMAWMYTVIVSVLLIAAFLLLRERRRRRGESYGGN